MKEPERILIIFFKKPEYGQAKTRLAASIGKENALEVYLKLMKYTARVGKESGASVLHYYSEYPDPETISELETPEEIRIQSGPDLGAKMHTAFENVLTSEIPAKGVLIGSDCAELTPEIISEAFSALDRADLVLGPAKDGGFYLIGMNNPHPDLLLNRTWSNSGVLAETLALSQKKSLNVVLLQSLSDVDTEADWNRVKEKFN